MNRITEVNGGGVGRLLWFLLGRRAFVGHVRRRAALRLIPKRQEPDLDTTDKIDPNAGYQPPAQERRSPLRLRMITAILLWAT